MSTIKIATVSMDSVPETKTNLQKYINFIEEAEQKGVDLIVFPESSLIGAPQEASMVSTNPECSIYFEQRAELIPEGDLVQTLIEKAKKHNMYICWNMTEQDPDFFEMIYNTAVLVGPEGYIGKHRKVHQPGTERILFYPGDEFEVFDTKIGRIGLMVCFEKAFPEPARALRLMGADIILCTTAWPVNDKLKGKEDYDLNRHLFYSEIRALENMVYFVEANQYGASGNEWVMAGHSRILDPEGKELCCTGFSEGMAIAEVDVENGIKKTFAYGFGIGTTSWIKDLRPEIYAPIYEEFKKRLPAAVSHKRVAKADVSRNTNLY